MMMNLYHSILFCLASCFCWSTAAASWAPTCCLRKFNGRIPERRIVSYTIQNAGVCPFEAIVFQTRRGKQLCYDPKMAKAIKLKDMIDQRKESTGFAEVPPNSKQNLRKSQQGKRQKRKRKQKKH